VAEKGSDHEEGVAADGMDGVGEEKGVRAIERGRKCSWRVLGSQGCGGDGGELNLAGEGASEVYSQGMVVGVLLLWNGE